MRFCKQCGAQNEGDANFCTSCGCELKQAATSPTSTPLKLESYNRKTIYLLFIILFIAIVGTIYHLQRSGLRIGNPSEKEPVVSKAPSPPPSKEKPVESLPKRASAILNSVFGSDREVGKIKSESPVLNSDLTDIEHASDYTYKTSECDGLFTDVIQQGAYSIEKELLNVTEMTESEENQIGQVLAKNVAKKYKGKLDIDEEWVKYVRKLGNEIASKVDRKGIKYHFHVIRDDSVNAFAIAGGGIYVFTGILNKIKNESQLLGILAHEIKHVDLRHCIALFQFLRKLPKTAQSPISSTVIQTVKHPYNARQEQDADLKGLELIYGLGYSPYQVVNYWESGASPPKRRTPPKGDPLINIIGRVGEELENVISTHPKNEKRACLLKNHIIKLQEELPRDIVYVGKWNYKHKVSMFKTMK